MATNILIGHSMEVGKLGEQCYILEKKSFSSKTNLTMGNANGNSMELY